MKCEEFNQWLDHPAIRSGGPLPAEAAEHLAVCRECSELLRWFSERGRTSELGTRLHSALRRRATSDLIPVRPLVKPGLFLLASTAFLAATVLLGSSLMGTTALLAMNPAQIVGIGVVWTGSAVFLSRSLRLQMVPGATARLATILSGLCMVAILTIPILILFPWHSAPDFIPLGLSCWAPGLMLAVPAALGWVWLARRGVFFSPDLAGGTIGMLAGVSGMMTIQLRCLRFEAPHLLVWHAGIVLAVSIMGLAGGHILSSIRREP